MREEYRVKYDPPADALYIRVEEGEVADSLELFQPSARESELAFDFILMYMKSSNAPTITAARARARCLTG